MGKLYAANKWRLQGESKKEGETIRWNNIQ